MQSFIRDLARALQERGHSVMAYAAGITTQRLLENDLVPIVPDLRQLKLKPDLIHTQNHLDAMAALAALPDRPALYHAHGATWRDGAPLHPRIYRYLAVSRTLAERITVESGLPPEKVGVLLNGIDIRRFKHIRELPARPAKALFYNSRIRADSGLVAAAQTACAVRGIQLDCIGYHFGQTTKEPETLLPHYDIVFASGIAALEALACGCAVIVIGRSSTGPLVTPQNFEALRSVNLSLASNVPEPSAEHVGAELDRYDAESGALVTRMAREQGNFQHLAEQLEGHYHAVLADHQSAQPQSGAEIEAMGRYLEYIAPLIKTADEVLDRTWGSPVRASNFDELHTQVLLLEKEVRQATLPPAP